MKNYASSFLTHIPAAALLLLSACNEIPAGAYYNRGDPENLIDVSSEVVNMSLNSSSSLAQLTAAVDQDPPTRAQLNCSHGDALCSKAKAIFVHHNIPVQWGAGAGGVTLVYERIMARDCENRYIDNSINPYNLEPPTFGCSLMANTVQMVSDRRQFVNPNLLDFYDGEKAVENYEGYLTPSAAPQQQQISTPIVGASSVGQ